MQTQLLREQILQLEQFSTETYLHDPGNWKTQIRQILFPVPSGEKLMEILGAIGLCYEDFYKAYLAEKYKKAFGLPRI